MSMDYWLKLIDDHGKYRQTAHIRNRHRIPVQWQAWCSVPMITLFPQGELVNKRFVCKPDGSFDVALYYSTFWRCDPVARTMQLAQRWSPGAHALWKVRQLFPRDVGLSYEYATYWQEGYVQLRIGDRILQWSKDLVLHVPKDGPTTVLEGGVPATTVDRSPRAVERLKLVRQRVREMRDLWEPMRASSIPSHEIFGGAAIKARFETGQPECIAHVIRWAESGKEHDPNVYASYVAIRNWYWGGDYLPDPLVRHADRRIARAVCAKVVE